MTRPTKKLKAVRAWALIGNSGLLCLWRIYPAKSIAINKMKEAKEISAFPKSWFIREVSICEVRRGK